jgi:hypothetical protein
MGGLAPLTPHMQLVFNLLARVPVCLHAILCTVPVSLTAQLETERQRC